MDDPMKYFVKMIYLFFGMPIVRTIPKSVYFYFIDSCIQSDCIYLFMYLSCSYYTDCSIKKVTQQSRINWWLFLQLIWYLLENYAKKNLAALNKQNKQNKCFMKDVNFWVKILLDMQHSLHVGAHLASKSLFYYNLFLRFIYCISFKSWC